MPLGFVFEPTFEPMFDVVTMIELIEPVLELAAEPIVVGPILEQLLEPELMEPGLELGTELTMWIPT